jgi:hypothetical protein
MGCVRRRKGKHNLVHILSTLQTGFKLGQKLTPTQLFAAIMKVCDVKIGKNIREINEIMGLGTLLHRPLFCSYLLALSQTSSPLILALDPTSSSWKSLHKTNFSFPPFLIGGSPFWCRFYIEIMSTHRFKDPKSQACSHRILHFKKAGQADKDKEKNEESNGAQTNGIKSVTPDTVDNASAADPSADTSETNMTSKPTPKKRGRPIKSKEGNGAEEGGSPVKRKRVTKKAKRVAKEVEMEDEGDSAAVVSKEGDDDLSMDDAADPLVS